MLNWLVLIGQTTRRKAAKSLARLKNPLKTARHISMSTNCTLSSVAPAHSHCNGILVHYEQAGPGHRHPPRPVRLWIRCRARNRHSTRCPTEFSMRTFPRSSWQFQLPRHLADYLETKCTCLTKTLPVVSCRGQLRPVTYT